MGIPVHRWVLAVVLAAVVVASGFRTFAPDAIEAPIAVAALAVPSTVLLGQDVAAFGAAVLPAGLEAERHLAVCHADGRCRAGTPGRLSGAGTWHGFAGTVPGDAVGTLDVAWVLGVDVGLDGGRAVAVARASSSVRALQEVPDARP